MDATYIQKNINQLKTNIFMHVRHRTLLQYTGEPVLNEEQLFYLLLPFFNGENWTDKMDKSIITVGIVHSSLSEHEKINESDATSKEQQLTVLSGDYYSGRYYQILAESGNITLIRKISEGIVQRCEQQVRVYENKSYTFRQWLESLTVIETALIKSFYTAYNFNQYLPIVENCLLLLRLFEEDKKHKNGETSPIYQLMVESSVQHEEPFERLILREIDTLTTNLLDYLQTSTFLHDDLKQYIKQKVLFSQK